MRRLLAGQNCRLKIAIAAGLALSIAQTIRIWTTNPRTAADQDYAIFHAGARAALGGFEGNIYDLLYFQERFGLSDSAFWVYPPTTLLLLLPFSVVTLAVAKALWIGLSAIAAAVTGRNVVGCWPASSALVFSPAVFVALFVGQLSVLFGLLLAIGLYKARERPLISGLCFGFLTIKPQYGILVPPFLVAIGAWRTITLSAICSLGLALASVLLFGIQIWEQYLGIFAEGGPLTTYIASSGHIGRITAVDALNAAGITLQAPFLIYGVLVSGAIIVIFRLAATTSFALLIAVTLVSTACVTPYFFIYDYMIIAVAILIVARGPADLPRLSEYLLAILWFAPILPLLFSSPLMPAVLWPITVLGAIAVITYASGKRTEV